MERFVYSGLDRAIFRRSPWIPWVHRRRTGKRKRCRRVQRRCNCACPGDARVEPMSGHRARHQHAFLSLTQETRREIRDGNPSDIGRQQEVRIISKKRSLARFTEHRSPGPPIEQKPLQSDCSLHRFRAGRKLNNSKQAPLGRVRKLHLSQEEAWIMDRSTALLLQAPILS